MAQCMFPYHVENVIHFSQEDRFTPVPCGQCPECLKRRVSHWVHRLEQEAKLHEKHYFLTLTYENNTVPISRNGFLSLSRPDLSGFFKRLRKNTGGHLRYYGAGEYGTRTKRPHYHVILFSDKAVTEEAIRRAWWHTGLHCPLGNVFFGTVRAESIRYTVGYITTGRWQPGHANDDRQPQFAAQSKSLGRNYLSPAVRKRIVEQPERPYILAPGGHKMSIPRYYTKKIFDFPPTQKLQRQIEAHPSLAIYIDDMQRLKKERSKIITKQINSLKKEDHDPKEIFERRKSAIERFKATHKKARTTC